jgi:hypothetical protein
MTSESLERVERAMRTLDPLVLRSGVDRKAFEGLEPALRSWVALWSLAVQSQRNGLLYFFETSPASVVRELPVAAERLGRAEIASELSTRIDQLVPRGRKGFSARALPRDRAEALEKAVMASNFEAAIVTRVLDEAASAQEAVEKARAWQEARERANRRRAAKARDTRAELVESWRATARPWSMRTRFAVGDTLTHPKFGVGIVRGLLGLDKIDVEFEDSRRTLIHGSE